MKERKKILGNLSNIDLLTGVRLHPIPFQVGAELTTTEWLCAIQSKLNECIDYVSSMNDNANEYTNAEIAKLDAKLIVEIEKVNLLIDEAKVSYENYTDDEITKLSASLDISLGEINDNLKERIAKENSLENKVADLSKIIHDASMSVVCPACGINVSVQDALYHIYNSIRVTISWAEFNAKISEKTWSEFDTMVDGVTWTKFEYDMNNVLSLNTETINLETN